MDLITELENEFSALNEQQSPSWVRVRTIDTEHELRLPQLGIDYLAGLCAGRVLVIPTSQIVHLESPQLPIKTEQKLIDFLERQKTPIRIRLATSTNLGSCWLLNIDGPWLRVAVAQGLSWVPISAIQSLEIEAVDNSKH